MLRPSLTTAAVALLCTGAMAQTDIKSRLQTITAPVKSAGVYHVATGTWTRGTSMKQFGGIGTDTIYNNTCSPVYFTGMLSSETFAHRSRLPSTTSPTTASIFYSGTPTNGHEDDTPENDSAPGCANSYAVSGFQVAYCSSAAALIDWRYQFASNYTACGATDMIPQYTVDVLGLPGGTSPAVQQCWLVDVDISGGTGGSILLSADGDGSYSGAINTDEFGFSFRPLSTAVAGDFTGPIIAGDFTWTGGPGTVSGFLVPCTGTDGTIWNNPLEGLARVVGADNNPPEEGTGMGSADFFRDSGTVVSAPSGSGCYYFGGNPHADFWLGLFAEPNCAPPDPLAGFCFPNAGGTRSCPCGNQPVPNGTRGCNNFGKTPPSSGDPTTATGGALLTASGTVSQSTATSLVFHVTRQHPTPSGNITILFMGSTTLSPGVISGAGVRCVSGLLTPRPYKGQSVYDGGTPGTCNIDFPNAGLPPPYNQNAFTRSSNPPPGASRHYYAAYRNTAAGNNHAPCTSTAAFNLSNAGTIVW